MTAQVPVLNNSIAYKIAQKSDTVNQDLAQWFSYTSSDAEYRGRASLLTTTNREKSKLTDIINDITTMYYGLASAEISPIQILQLYDRLTNWKKDLPESIRELEVRNEQALPHVLCLL